MTHTRLTLITLTLLLVAAPLLAQQRDTSNPEERAQQAAAQAAFERELVMANPIEPLDSIWIEELSTLRWANTTMCFGVRVRWSHVR